MPILPRRTNLRILCRRPRRFARAYRAALVLLSMAVAADAVTTLRNMRQFGADIELHIVQRLVSELLGVNLGVPVAKLIQLGFVLLVASWWRPWCAWMLWGCAVLYALAALSNHFMWL
jgi:hypothetical protein